MVCVSTSFLLVVTIITARFRKVNRSGASFTICLQNRKNPQKPFINRSKSFGEF